MHRLEEAAPTRGAEVAAAGTELLKACGANARCDAGCPYHVRDANVAFIALAV